MALKGLSFSVAPGRVLGFLGPNGAGKTTAIRILTTILEPAAGEFVVDGITSDHPEQIRRKIGVLPESLGFPKNLTGLEYLTFYGQLYGRPASMARERGGALLEEVGLQHRARSLVGTYSRGMRQRLGIARALVNDPSVVFLDEPTSGLDPRSQTEVLTMVRAIAKDRDAGVVLCSHLLWEIENFCDDVIILNAGQVVASGTVVDVIARAHRSAIRIHVAPARVAEAQRMLRALPVVRSVAPTGETEGWLAVEPMVSTGSTGASSGDAQFRNAVLDVLIRAGIPVLSVDAEGGLHDVFLSVTEEAPV
jgi:ABC-2 type transport system ATP-binding protein